LRMSKLFGNTLREVPAGAQTLSQQLLLRAGLIRQVAPATYSYLPLGWSVLRKIEGILREEMDALGGQEMRAPCVTAAEVRPGPAPHHEAKPVAARFADGDRPESLICTSQDGAITQLARNELHSYRQLPCMVYQIHTKVRDESRASGGLVGARYLRRKDGYSFHPDQEDLDVFYDRVFQAYQRVLRRCGVEAVSVAGDPAAAGELASHSWVAVTDTGDDVLIVCKGCGYSAHAYSAIAAIATAVEEPWLPLLKVATPEATTIDAVAQYLGVPRRQTLKAIFYVAEGELVCVLIRGDLEVNEVKLAHLLEVQDLKLAEPEEVQREGIVAGYASPVGRSDGPRIVSDQSATMGSNFVAGANEPGYHFRNVNYPRDFRIDVTGQFAAVRDGDACAVCGAELRALTTFELGRLRQLGIKWSGHVGATFLDANGRPRPLVMGRYAFDLGRLMSAAVEQSHDERGIIWPLSITPYQVHLVSLGSRPEIVEAAETLYEDLSNRRFEVLYDDREESAGVKFNDADLIGIPLRLTVSSRSLAAGGAEVKRRSHLETEVLSLHAVPAQLRELVEAD
jgi:prolyl-tRNA synthetase